MKLKGSLFYLLIVTFFMNTDFCCAQEQNYDKDIEILNNTLDSIKSTLGEEHLDYGKNLIRLSKLYKRQGKFDLALQVNIQANEIFNKENEHKELAKGLTNLSQIYGGIGEFDKAISIQKEALLLYSNEENNNINYLGGINNLAILYAEIGDYKKAIPIFKEILEILPKTHKGYLNVSVSFAEVLQRSGNYESALDLYLQLLETSDEKHQAYPILLQNLAFVYVKLGEFERATQIYDDALISMEGQLGKEHYLYGKLLNNVGKLYFQMGNYTEAQVLFKDALDNLLINFDESNKQYGYYLNDYATTFLYLGNYNEAISLLQDNVELGEKYLNKESLDYWNRKYHLANAYNVAERYNEAKPILEETTLEVKKILGEDHTDYGKMLKSLSDTYVGLDRVDKAIPLIEVSNNIFVNQLNQVFQFRSEQEKKAYLQLVLKYFDDIQSIPINKNKNYSELNSINLNNQLMLKGLLLNNSKDILEKLTSLNDTLIQNKVIAYRSKKRKLSQLLTQSIEDRQINTDSLKDVINNLESELVKLYSLNFSSDINFIKNWKDLQSKLNPNDIAIEYAHFQLTKGNRVLDSVMYVAYVYKKNWEYPKMIPLCKGDELYDTLSEKSINQLYASRGSKVVNNSNIKDVYELVWKPLEGYLNEVQTVYYSPSGLLNQIPFAALNIADEPVLSEQFNLVQLSSTDMLGKNKVNPDISNACFIGGVIYEYIGNSTVNTDTVDFVFLNSESIKRGKSNRSRGDNWTYLPGTLEEIEGIQTILNSKNYSYTFLTANEASEANFKKLSGNSPSILHIATHGFFFENVKSGSNTKLNIGLEDELKFAQDPLLRSGLLLAGANYAWKHGNNPFEKEDGVLTALEISNMDLSQTDMVVLSACETGLGDIDGSEGVYGLQRAFKMAGVDIIVMSLWQVPDVETAEFMNLFYKNWLRDADVKIAFNAAQRTMQVKYKSEPLKWAAFVLFE